MYGLNYKTQPKSCPIELQFGSLPAHYPKPPFHDKSLFYIQRNHNVNTILYELNTHPCGSIIDAEPIIIFWKRYDEDGELRQLNYIQDKLVYGYHSKKINNDAYQFNMVADTSKAFYLVRGKDKEWKATTLINDTMCQLHHMYVYATAQGAFPSIKHVELFGSELDSDTPVYEKLVL